MRATIDRTRRGEEGATATAFLLSFFVLLGIAMLAMDGGSLYLSKRGQVADTDSAALAAARAAVEDPCVTNAAATARATDLTARNDGSTTVESVDRSGSVCDDDGVITVATRRDPDSYFGSVFGFGSETTAVRSRAAFGGIPNPSGIRPIGICSADPHYAAWKAYLNESGADPLADWLAHLLDPDHPTHGGVGTTYPGATSAVHRIAYEKVDDSDCGAATGNWGLIDFDGTAGGAADTKDWIENGYEPGVDIATGDCDADTAAVEDCGSETGLTASIKSALDKITCDKNTAADPDDCTVVHVVVYDCILKSDGERTCDTGETSPGTNATYDLVDVVSFVLRGYKLTPQKNAYIDIEFVDFPYVGGQVGSTPDGSTGPRGAQLCGADGFDTCPFGP